MNPSNPAHYDQLAGAVSLDTLTHLVSFWPLQPGDDPLLHLVQLARMLEQRRAETHCKITLVTEAGAAVTALESVVPQTAALAAALQSMALEDPLRVPLCLDVVRNGNNPTRLGHQLALACTAEIPYSQVCLRGHQFLAQTVTAHPLVQGSSPVLTANSNWLVVGALGDVGHTFARALGTDSSCHLILTGRTPETQLSPLKKERLQNLQALEAKVSYLQVDATNVQEMGDLVTRVRRDFGGLHGLIYGPGGMDKQLAAPLAQLDSSAFAQHLNAKLVALQQLESILNDVHELRFCLFTSSLAALLGGLGMGAYAVGNRAMDALVHEHNRKHWVPWITLNLDAFQTTADRAFDGSGDNPFAGLAISDEDGSELLQRALVQVGMGQLLVSTTPLQPRLARTVTTGQASKAETKAPASARMPRPNLQQIYVAPRNDLERTITDILEDVLGLEKVGVYDSFFDLGGNSLAGVQVIAQVKRALAITISSVALYEAPTPAALAELVSAEKAALEAASQPESSESEPADADAWKTRGAQRKNRKKR